MENTKRNILPKEKYIRSSDIHNISEYLGRVAVYIKERRQAERIVVYRGEPAVYDRPCCPNLFRKQVLTGNVFFEKNLFDTMRQNKLTGEKRYLENAIDAQHGEFPSRLLDVSYNCLTALYFAVTPYYHKAEDFMDQEDGMVYLLFVDEIYSPSAQNTNDAYEALIRRDQEWYRDNSIFWNSHKFIDHTKQNDRIIAQQGAFILFAGEQAEELPEYMYCGIRIPKDAKPLIREELKLLFGIHTGSVYPEIINLVRELSQKSQKLNTEEFNCRNELGHVLEQMKRELQYYLDYALEQKERENMDQILLRVEHRICHYRSGLVELIEHLRKMETPALDKESRRQAIERYNRALREFSAAVGEYGLGRFSCEALQIIE